MDVERPGSGSIENENERLRAEIARLQAQLASDPAARNFGPDSSTIKSMEPELRLANESLTATLEALPDLMVEMDRGGIILTLHPSRFSAFKLASENVIGQSVFNFLSPDQFDFAKDILEKAIVHGQQQTGVFPIQFEGQHFWYEISIVAKGDRLPAERVVVIARDNTARVQAELTSTQLASEVQQVNHQLATMNRQLEAINSCRQALIRATDELSLFQDICAIVCDKVGYRMAWVALTGPEPEKRLRPVAMSGSIEGFQLDKSLSWADGESGQGPAAKAVRTGKTALVSDFQTITHPIVAKYLAAGVLSAMALPLIAPDHAILGVLTIYADHPDAFSEAEIQLLETLAIDLAFGAASLRARADRDRVQNELESSSKKLDTIFTLSPDAIVLTGGDDHRVIDCNQAYLDLLGYNLDEIIGHSASELGLWSPENRQVLFARGESVEEMRNFELAIPRKDGSRVTVLISSRHIEIENEVYIMSFVHDITDRKRAEEVNLARLDLIQFSTSHSLEELLEATLNKVEALTHSQIAFYHFLGPDQTTLRQQNWSTRTREEFCTALDKNHVDDLMVAGIWADAIRLRQVVIHNDYASVPNRKGLPEGHALLSRELIYPVMRGDQIMAVVGVGNKPEDYTQQDVETITLFASLAWEIVQRVQAENALQANMEQIERFNRLAVGREGRVIDLKNEVNGLAQALGNPLPYPAVVAIGSEPGSAEAAPAEPPSEPGLKISTDLSLKEILDLSQVENLLEPLSRFASCVLAIFDPHGEVLMSTPPTSICGLFHLQNEITRRDCAISDMRLISQLNSGKPVAISRCINGLMNAAAPIVLDDRILAYLFIGEFFTEPPDLEIFRQVARQMGFDEASYLQAVQATPIHSEDSIPIVLNLLSTLVSQVTGFAYDRWLAQKTEELMKQRADELHRQQQAAVSLAEDAELARLQIAVYRDHLEELVQDRTSQLTETAARLESANQELEAFTYSVSHDLRAPLRSVDGFSQILLEEYTHQLDTEGQNYLKRIRSGAERMSLLIEDLLHLSRISRAEIHPTRVNLSQMAQEISAELAEAHPDRHVTTIIAPDLVTLVDNGLAHVILENLISNAWKFTSRHADANIEFGAIKRDGQVVYFIKDDGAGFNPDYAYKLFSVFQRLHNEKDFPGTGVGLATVKRVIARHGGRIWAEGETERGATFFFTLPWKDPVI